MVQPSRLKTVVVHDDGLVDAGLAATLSRHPDIHVLEPCPASLPNGAMLRWLADQAADIVITDYDRGLRLVESMQRSQVPLHRVQPRAMIVTDRVTQAEIRTALKRGVAGYLAITSPAEEIIDAVRKVGMGMRHVSEPLAHRLLDNLLADRLTPREAEVLQLAAQGCPNKVIAAQLKVELGTVKCHMRAVLDKLGARNRTEAVVTANRRGLLALHRDSADRWSPASAVEGSAAAGWTASATARLDAA